MICLDCGADPCLCWLIERANCDVCEDWKAIGFAWPCPTHDDGIDEATDHAHRRAERRATQAMLRGINLQHQPPHGTPPRAFR